MDIAAMSIGFNQMKVCQEASLSVLKMAMDTASEEALYLTKLLEMEISPHIGGNIDLRV